MPFITQCAIDEVSQLQMPDGGLLAGDYHGRQVIEAAEAYLKQKDETLADPVPVLEFFERREDMGTGRLQFILDGDADVIVTVIDKEGHATSVEFCTPVIGGGRSPKVREALINVMKAIREENLTSPLPT